LDPHADLHSFPTRRSSDLEATGDLLTITLDPYLEFGAETTAFSEQGVFQSPIKLVDRNQVIATSASPQYAQYLKIPETTTRGNRSEEHTSELQSRVDLVCR